MQISLGHYQVIQVKLNSFTVRLCKGVYTTVSVPFLPAVKVGDFVQLYTDVEAATINNIKVD